MIRQMARQSITYTPYGDERSADGLHMAVFCGYPRDPLTCNYILGKGYRQYSPVMMRFLSLDVASPFREGGVNTYAYCNGDPVNYKDSTGMAKTGTTRLLKQHNLPKKTLKPLLKALFNAEHPGMKLTIIKKSQTEAVKFVASVTEGKLVMSSSTGSARDLLPAGHYLSLGDIYTPWRKGASSAALEYRTGLTPVDVGPSQFVELDRHEPRLRADNAYTAEPVARQRDAVRSGSSFSEVNRPGPSSRR